MFISLLCIMLRNSKAVFTQKTFRLSFTLSIFSIDEKKNSHAFATVAKSPYLQRSSDSKLEEDQETKRTW